MGRIGVLSLETIPRGLKPHTFLAACGTAKAVPFQRPITAGSSVVRQKWSYFQMGRIGVLSLETIPRGLKPHTFLAACGTAKAVPFQNE